MKKFKIYAYSIDFDSEEFDADHVVKDDRWVIITRLDGSKLHIPIEHINYLEEINK